jgi:HAE1 family hydrophobic/amphiphilic exporter-1
MFPMSLGIGESGEAWAPLARAVMGGLIVATALTLVVIPVVYTLFESVSMRFKAWKERRAARESPELSTEERATLM